VLKPGDEPLHYSDGGHRFTCPDPDGAQEEWAERIRAHVALHLAGEGNTPSSMLPPMKRGPDS
jgi:hypothetical protein